MLCLIFEAPLKEKTTAYLETTYLYFITYENANTMIRFEGNLFLGISSATLKHLF